MKNFQLIKTVAIVATILLASTTVGSAQEALTGTSGTLQSGIAYTVSNDVGTLDSTLGSGDYLFSETATITLNFSSAVDLSIEELQFGSGPISTFGGSSGLSGVFTADAGAWTATSNNSSELTFTGIGTTTLTGTVPTGAVGGVPLANADWGGASISGVTSVTYKSVRDFGTDGFNFSAVAAVPEPSSMVLLGAGVVGLLLRRKRS